MKKIILICALLTGCATPQYQAKDGSPAPEQALLECEYEANKATASATDANPMQGPYGGIHALLTNSTIRKRALVVECMKVRGYR